MISVFKIADRIGLQEKNLLIEGNELVFNFLQELNQHSANPVGFIKDNILTLKNEFELLCKGNSASCELMVWSMLANCTNINGELRHSLLSQFHEAIFYETSMKNELEEFDKALSYVGHQL